MWFERRLDSITLADLEALVQDRVREHRSLDYKGERPVPAQANNDKKSDFAVDVSALANGIGGLLAYGIEEEREDNKPTGMPQRITGLRDYVLDAEENRLRSFLETALDPRLPTGLLEFHAVPGGEEGPVLLVRVNRSFAGPHMVRADGRSRNGFYVRDGARNRNLDARGVREAMLASGDWSRRFRAFRDRRVAAVLEHNGPVSLEGGGRIILHVAPAALDDHESSVDPRECKRLAEKQRLLPFRMRESQYCSHHFNIDGLLITTPGINIGYLQMFRSGALETVDAMIIDVQSTEVQTGVIEQLLIEKLPSYFQYLQGLNIPPPYVVGLTICGVRGRQHQEQRERDRAAQQIPKFDRDIIMVPEIVVDSEQLRLDITTVLEPVIHAMWQAGGHPGCPRYRDGMYDRRITLE